ncbi:FRG domain-containing protein [Vibrio owensii]|uniref:FRG domain-containing protein n=1 Tax=Vibrio owensii TaxID=696485 RepID=UPI000596D8C2|nr:FRG domain-containing protein [Vibrio owensii]
MRELSKFIEDCGQEQFFPMYRGQSDIDWALTPSIGRLHDVMNNKVIHSSWESFEYSILTQFKRLSEPYIDTKPSTRLEWLVEAQHYGLSTPLLDWSTSPLKALYFAVENPAYDEKDAAVYVIQPDSVRWESESIDEFRYLEFYFPKHTNERIIAQDACFTVFPYPQTIAPLDDLKDTKSFSANSLRSLRTIRVPAEHKRKLREQLADMGIHRMSIYPGLESVSKHIMNSVI